MRSIGGTRHESSVGGLRRTSKWKTILRVGAVAAREKGSTVSGSFREGVIRKQRTCEANGLQVEGGARSASISIGRDEARDARWRRG